MAWTRRAYDTFTDASLTALTSHTPDEGSAWSYDGGGAVARIHVDGDKFNCTSDGYIRNTSSLGDDQAVSANILTGGVYLLARYNGNAASPTGYCLECRDGLSFRLWSFNTTGDPRQNLIASGGTGSTNDVGRLEFIGSAYEVFINGVSQFSGTDATYSSGSAGLYGISGQNADDFQAFDDSGTPAQDTPELYKARFKINQLLSQ